MFYIFHGEDELTKRETLLQLLSRLGDQALLDLNTSRFGGAVLLTELRQAVETMPFLAPARVILVEDLFTSKPGKAYLDELFDFLTTVPETSRLVFLESHSLREKHPALIFAREGEKGLVRAFPLPKGSQIDRWIQIQTTKKGGEISPKAANLLASMLGNDVRILDNELEKLVMYKRGSASQTIEPEDVLLVSPYVAEANIFDLVDALGSRNGKAASTLYQRKLNEGADAFYLFSMFVRQFRLLIQVKELIEDGYNSQAAASELRLHEYVAGKLANQARGFTMSELESIYRHLLKIDVAVKNGSAEMHTELDLLVAGLTYSD